MQSSEPIGASKVIARANPIILGTGWMLLGAGLLLHVRVLDKYGWRNPEAFVGLPSSRHAWFYDIAFIGHAIAAGLALLLAVVTFKLALPAIRGFNDVIVENGRLHYASRPWMGKSAVSDISARVVPSYQGGFCFARTTSRSSTSCGDHQAGNLGSSASSLCTISKPRSRWRPTWKLAAWRFGVARRNSPLRYGNAVRTANQLGER